MEQEKINRINELARKAKTQTLTPEELEEQKQLRIIHFVQLISLYRYNFFQLFVGCVTIN